MPPKCKSHHSVRFDDNFLFDEFLMIDQVCCSPYGFCGTTSDFCTKTDDEDTSCQSNCGYPDEPSCSSNDVLKRVIGYYESWSSTRKCDSWRPGNIAAGSLTHLNFAFALFEEYDDDEWGLYFDETETDDVYDLISEFIDLKKTNLGLSCFLSIGGWSFNDGATASYWSDMASTAAGRKSWSKDVLSTIMKYGFDGVDLDWEYPVADDRGGSDKDKDNYIKLLKELRSVFDETGVSYGITFTIPTSYWYLRNFDISSMIDDTGVDWVNVMSYDLHGTWDGDSP
jgi:chitinase